MPGTLYLVATPIGNLEDITARALRILAEVDMIAAEDTRVSRRLLNHFNIKKPLISYYEQNKRLREAYLIEQLQLGKNIALISDAGTPGLSDPGTELVRAAIAADINVITLPGASALLTALPASGLDDGPFCFEGFLPREKQARRQRLLELAADSRPTVFYEAPHRLRATLDDLATCWGGERPLAVCRELTKLHEEFVRGSISELAEHFTQTEPRGEFTLVVSGAPAQAADSVDPAQVEQELQRLMEQGLKRKQAARLLAEQYGLSVSEVYQLGLNTNLDR